MESFDIHTSTALSVTVTQSEVEA